MRNSAILLSGGMDSIALAYWKRPRLAITIDYGQIAAKSEINSAVEFCKIVNMEHLIIQVDCSSIGVGEMLNEPALDISPAPEWWPFRNQMLITFSCMKLISYNISELLVGSVSSDSLYLDGTSYFYGNIDKLISSQEGNIHIKAPAINMKSSELTKKSKIPLSILALAHSCHTGNFACGKCRGCEKHRMVMAELKYPIY